MVPSGRPCSYGGCKTRPNQRLVRVLSHSHLQRSSLLLEKVWKHRSFYTLTFKPQEQYRLQLLA